MRTSFVALAFGCLLFGAPGHAQVPKLAEGCWDALVRPGARWVLLDQVREGPEALQVVVETQDVHTVGKARVASLKWSVGPGAPSTLKPLGAVFAQVLVTDEGATLLEEVADEAHLAVLLRKKPAFANPPRNGATVGTVSIAALMGPKGVLLCLEDSFAMPPKGEACEDICDAELCISPTDGIVSISGRWAPDMGSYNQKGYTTDLPAAIPEAETCASSVDCPGAQLCFQRQCVARKSIHCPSGAPGCPPTYWRMYWYLERLCQDRFTQQMHELLKTGVLEAESTTEDLEYLVAFADALRGAEISSKAIGGFFYDPGAAGWLPHPCADGVRRWKEKPLPESMLRWQKELRGMLPDIRR